MFQMEDIYRFVDLECVKCKEGDSHSEGGLQACVQDHVLSLPASAAVVDGPVLSVTLQKQVKWEQIVITDHSSGVCVHACMDVCVPGRGSWADMCLETLITSLKQQGC